MSHGFVVRTGTNADIAQRAARMEAAGWRVAHPNSSIVMAWQGAAEHCLIGPLSFCGLVFLDDRPALCAALDLSHKQTANLSDLALLAQAYAVRKAELTTILSGSFSVLIYDQDSGKLEGYRDHFGIYPFYFAGQGKGFCAGSDPRAVLHLSGISLKPDPRRIADFIHGNEIDRDRTAFAGLARLPAAHRLSADAECVKLARYWEPVLPPLQPTEGAPERLFAALQAATDARTTAGTGVMLSGGLDSTSLAGLAARSAKNKGRAPLRTMSFVYGPDKPYDESHYINEANAAFGTEGHAIAISGPPNLTAMGPLIEEQMDLFLAPGLQKSRRIYAEAKALGLTALIDGHGGDEVISHGYARLVELAANRSWWRLFVEAQGAARVHGTSFWGIYLGHIVQFGGLSKRSLRWRVMRRIAGRLLRGNLLQDGLHLGTSVIAPDLRTAIKAETRYAHKPSFTEADYCRNAARLQNLEEISTPLVENAFERLHCSATAAGILPLYPFFDRRVVELCLALPGKTKLRGGQTRWVLREAMRGILPESIRSRYDKAEYSAEITEAVADFYAMRGNYPFRGLSAWLDMDRVEALHRKALNGALKEPYAIMLMWRLAVLLQWSEALSRWQKQQTEGTLI